MRSFKTSKRFSYKNLIYKSLIFIATVSVIVYFLPNEGKFNYQFDINKPWKYGLLQASFDFPIYKNDLQVQKEQDSILADYQPYFQIDKEAEKNVLSKLREDYNKTLRHSLPGTDYVRYIERTLKALYEDGIIASVIGSVLGYVCTIFIEAATSDTIQLVAIPVMPILEATLLAVGACLLATAIPLRKISKMNIVDSIETVE